MLSFDLVGISEKWIYSDFELFRCLGHIFRAEKTMDERTAYLRKEGLSVKKPVRQVHRSSNTEMTLYDVLKVYGERNSMESQRDRYKEENDWYKEEHEKDKSRLAEYKSFIEQYKNIIERYENVIKQFQKIVEQKEKTIRQYENNLPKAEEKIRFLEALLESEGIAIPEWPGNDPDLSSPGVS